LRVKTIPFISEKVILMVLKSEARCPKCFVQEQYTIDLHYDPQTNKFVCARNSSHVFHEDKNGFLKAD